MFSIKHAQCPKCKRSAGPLDFVKHHVLKRWYKMWGGKNRVFTADCPACHNSFPLDHTECPHCKIPVAIFPLFLSVARPYLKFIQGIKDKAENLSRGEVFLISMTYFATSVLIVIFLINRIEAEIVKGNLGNMIIAAVASLICMSVSFLLFRWILPPNISDLVSRLKAIFKISLAINYVSFVLLLVIVTDHWSMKSWILIGTFFMSIVAVWFAGTFVVPAWFGAAAILTGTYGTPEPDPNKRGRDSTHRPNRLA